MAANYAAGTLGLQVPDTIGVLEMGGASVQVGGHRRWCRQILTCCRWKSAPCCCCCRSCRNIWWMVGIAHGLVESGNKQ